MIFIDLMMRENRRDWSLRLPRSCFELPGFAAGQSSKFEQLRTTSHNTPHVGL
jgi:hypothetical protein